MPGLQTASATFTAPTPARAKPASVDARLAAGQELIDAKEPGYAVQLMVTDAHSRDYLERYLVDAARSMRPDQFFLVPAGGVDTPRVGVLLGTYRERAEALAALDALPEGLRQFKPYVRTLDAVREDARRAAPR